MRSTKQSSVVRFCLENQAKSEGHVLSYWQDECFTRKGVWYSSIYFSCRHEFLIYSKTSSSFMYLTLGGPWCHGFFSAFQVHEQIVLPIQAYSSLWMDHPLLKANPKPVLYCAVNSSQLHQESLSQEYCPALLYLQALTSLYQTLCSIFWGWCKMVVAIFLEQESSIAQILLGAGMKTLAVF